MVLGAKGLVGHRMKRAVSHALLMDKGLAAVGCDNPSRDVLLHIGLHLCSEGVGAGPDPL